ncbi:hypothetical protein GSY71_10225 [Pusillimonas sp. TS35]|uniref:TadE/TadG family type IV pilus assembly protein n=1 Tax=Paracandidimonas lactea TaxID=2895524 RepID=UPI00136E6713|nr:pilus assembly protein TadG-related protein [Paracandidimonas lactea]MYN13511.1 hypothetical protein [Pusillimonas sp. TS35]
MSLRKRFWSVLSDSRGAVAPMFLVSATAVLGTSFGAIDLVRYNVVQGKVQSALDGATLSAGRNLANLTPTPGTPAEEQWKSDAFQYFRANLPDGFLGSRIAPEDLTITYTEEMSPTGNFITGQYIDMQATGVLPLISTGFLHVASMDINARNRALRRTRTDLEVVMALDNTGSMSSDGKIDTLKSASRELASIVLGASQNNPGTPSRVFVGLVPFADTVNVGNTEATRQWLRSDWAGPGQPLNSFVNNRWKGCIVEPWPAGGGNLPAASLTPTAGFMPLTMGVITALVDKSNSLGLSPKDKGTTTYYRIMPDTADIMQPRSFAAKPVSAGMQLGIAPSGAYSFRLHTLANPSNCQDSRLTRFLSNDLTTINSAIDAMQANGNTLIPTGLLWAWRMLNPVWRGTPGWGDPDMPRDPDPDRLSKVIILLTDGQNAPSSGAGPASGDNTFAFSMGFDKEQCTDQSRTTCTPGTPSPTPPVATDFSFGISSDAQAPLTSLKMRDPFSTGALKQNTSIGWGNDTSMSTSSVDAYLAAVCQQVKNDGNAIKIYTVTLGVVGGATETLMNNCSSGAGYFYNATNVADLPNVFRSIAGALTELRLTR